MWRGAFVKDRLVAAINNPDKAVREEATLQLKRELSKP